LAQLTLKILSHREIDPQKWDSFVMASPQGSLYALHGYASTVAAEWQAAIVHQGGEWRAVMPFVAKQKWGLTYSFQPLCCQYWGILFAPFSERFYKQTCEERKCLELLLPVWARFRLVKYHLSPTIHDLLPFHWNAFTLKPRVSYVLELKNDKQQLWAEVASSLQRQIKKGKKYDLQYASYHDISMLFSLIEKQKTAGHDILSGAKDGEKLLKKVGAFLLENRFAKLFFIHQKENPKPLAVGLFAYFKGRCIYMIGAYDPDEKQLGAMSQLMWHTILDAQQNNCEIFDFEGSMIQGVEGFFRKFGAKPQTYFEISKNTLPLPLRWMDK